MSSQLAYHPSIRTSRPPLSVEQKLDQTIDYLEKHNEEVR